MSFDTYANFQIEVYNWIDRPDLSSQIPSFISLAEAVISRRCKGVEREVRAQATVTASSRYVALPGAYQGMKNLSIRPEDGGGYLEQRSKDFMDRLVEQNAGTSTDSAAVPYYFAINGNEIELYPVPGSDTVLEMSYTTTLPKLSVAGTNDIFEDHPDIYLYATLVEAAPYVGEDERAIVWKATLDDRINQYNIDAEQREWGAAPLVRQPTIKLTRSV